MAVYHRNLGLDMSTLTRGTSVLEHTLAGGRCLTRTELREALDRGGIKVSGVRLARSSKAWLCSGPRRQQRFTYALLSGRAPKAIRLSREEAIGAPLRGVNPFGGGLRAR